LKNSQKEKSFNFELFFNDFVDYVEKSSSYELEDGLSISIKKSTNGDFKSFQTQGRVKRQSLTYQIIKRDFDDFLNGEISRFEDIKPTFESRNPYHGNARYYFKLYQRMRDFLERDSDKYILDDIKRQNYYIVIDEINRANISKVFGELITLIEEDKRDVLEVILPYSKEPFSVPSNLYIIGTMNSTDKSIALIDVALRRRFTFLKMVPNSELVYPDIKEKFQQLNRYVSETLGEDYQIGHSYFMNITNSDDLDFILRYKIEPLLEEYFYGDKSAFDKACKIIGIN
jgi:5-methylcytosine-specific restriction protein B